ncbi:hypothetical protein A5844_001526 [Enterococcus sp. 10A9_DIV0425]|uniref:Transposase putative helix-turn-helix domain-containing protein n=1 Tax=Candidatus Enterococcus wittei TaxID=1987383 RepID=A0A242K157_9ENTE|nr:RNA-guided endonuclease TnpB family protein [Enterococcus sp. 10A9_DIV0425]OTP11391.1 hypothetical protein A5844_001526 [Enterococcus sp. 10A9_DIV0425]THE11974.1 transposase [Enterococcus hirae]
MLKAFKFRIYPTPAQKQWLIQTFGCVRFTYNHLLKARQAHYAETKEIDYTLTPAVLKKQFPFLKETDSLALANAQLNLDRAFRNYFKGRTSLPKLKNKKSIWQSYTTNNQKGTIYLEDKYLKLPKLKEKIRIHVHRPLEGTIRSATISSRYNEVFYVSLLCDVSPKPLVASNRWIGVAYDPHALIETSTPIDLVVPKFNRINQKIFQAKRKLAVKGKAAQKRKIHVEKAKNYQKQKRKIKDLYLKQKYQREDYLEQISGALVRNFDYLFIESRPKSCEESDFSTQLWDKLITKIRYKAQWYNKNLLLIDMNEQKQQVTNKKSHHLEKIGVEVVFK